MVCVALNFRRLQFHKKTLDKLHAYVYNDYGLSFFGLKIIFERDGTCEI